MFAMQEEDFEREVKVVIVGNGGVGKTSLIRQFCKGYCPIEYKKTIGVDFLEKTQYITGLQEQVKLLLWDTAGQEIFDSMTRSYYRGAKAAVLCFSTEDRRSFDSIKTWKKKIEEECGKIPMVLVQNKVDLLDQALVSRQEGEELAEQLGLRFYRICVKQNLYVSAVFEYLAEMFLRRECFPVHPPGKPLAAATATGRGEGKHSAFRSAMDEQQQKNEIFHQHVRNASSSSSGGQRRRCEIRESKNVFRDCRIL